MKSRLKPYILLIPVSLILLGIMGVGIINCIFQSLGYFEGIGLYNISFAYYKEVLSNPKFISSFFFTLNIALTSSMLATILGVIFAYFLSKDKFSTFRYGLVNLPIIIPHIIVVLLMIMLFSKTGFIARLLYNIGIINDPSQFFSLVSDKNGIGIILVYLWKGIPFTAVTTYNILKNTSDKLESVAMNLGANKLQSFIHVILPLSLPAILSSFILLFAFSFGAFEVPFLIGPSTPKTLAVEAYLNYISSDLTKRPIAMCINVILSLLSFLLLMIYNKIFKKIYNYKI